MTAQPTDPHRPVPWCTVEKLIILWMSPFFDDVDRESNPFLHIAIHAVVENQLEARDPIEAY